jgi:hypothetical protein
MSAPERVAVKMTTGYETNYWGVLTHEHDEEGVVYVREDILAAAILAERERCNGIVLVASCVESGDVRHVLDNVSEAILKGGAA